MTENSGVNPPLTPPRRGTTESYHVRWYRLCKPKDEYLQEI
ncbi:MULTISPECIES: hypothetical protein [unclassified Okeania]|nr:MULTISPECIES: hypothetical protein [unclassified Okeania]